MTRGREPAHSGLAGALERHPAVGIAGAVVGLAAATTAVGVAVARIATRRVRADRLSPTGALPEGASDAEVAPGDPVVLWGPGDDGEPTAQQWADVLDTIHYELVTRVGGRFTRRYVGSAGAV